MNLRTLIVPTLALVLAGLPVLAASAALDDTPPVSSWELSGPSERASDGQLWIGPTTDVILTADDASSGIAQTWYRVDEGDATLYEGTFNLLAPSGTHTLTIWSVDTAGNVEAPVTVRLGLDADGPRVTLTNPREGTLTVSEVVVAEEGADTWHLDYRGMERDVPAPVALSTGGRAVIMLGTYVRAEAVDEHLSVEYADLYTDGFYHGPDYRAPYEWAWNWIASSQGPVTITVKAYDRFHNAGVAEMQVTNGLDPTAAPAFGPQLP